MHRVLRVRLLMPLAVRCLIVLAVTALCLPLQAQPRGTFVHLFEWRWEDVARECEQVLGPAGYVAVQISPPNEHIDHRRLPAPYTNAWWARYQPVSYRLISRSGTEQAFDDMVQRCRAAGVAIYADAVINHMADKGEAGVGGTPFYLDALSYADYDARNFNPYCSIRMEDYQLGDSAAINAQRARRIRRCRLGNLPDLDTSQGFVQARLARYLQQLLDRGVTGLRIDAAKHIVPEDLGAILSRLRGEPFVFQEFIDGGGQPVRIEDNLTLSAVTEFRYGQIVGEAFLRGRLHELRTLEDALVPGERAVAFIDNHDNQRGHGMSAPLSHRQGIAYRLANVFMLAWPYGYPKVMSSYAWGSDTSQGPPHDGDGNTLPVYLEDGSDRCGTETWLCEHRWPTILAMVRFRSEVDAAGAGLVTNWWDNGRGQIAFARTGADGVAGFVAINRDIDPLRRALAVDLPAGRYCDTLTARSGDGACGRIITVDESGRADIDLAPNGALAIYRASRLDAP
jgi:alpha-amylase